jgi:hypothetical protein
MLPIGDDMELVCSLVHFFWHELSDEQESYMMHECISNRLNWIYLSLKVRTL